MIPNKVECQFRDICIFPHEGEGGKVIDLTALPLSARLIANIKTGKIWRYRFVQKEGRACCILKKWGVRVKIYKYSLGSRDIYELILSDIRGRVLERQTESWNEGPYSLKKLYDCAFNLVLKKEKRIKTMTGKF